MDQATIDKLKVLDKASQEKNRAALALQRAKSGHVALTCHKCGAESIVDAKRPAKPAAKCGICGEALS